MAVSQKIRNFMEQGSWIRRMFEEGIQLKQQFGEENVFDLSLGNPVMQPPPEFFEELRRIANDPEPGIHRYMPNAGYEETRAAVASQLSGETSLDFGANEIVMTCGAGGALNVVLKTLLDPGDEVIIFAPFFVEYHFYADNHGGSCRVVPPDENFLPDMEALRERLQRAHEGGPHQHAEQSDRGAVLRRASRRNVRSNQGSRVRARTGDISRKRRALSQAAFRRLWNTRTSSVTTSAVSSPRPTPRTWHCPANA